MQMISIIDYGEPRKPSRPEAKSKFVKLLEIAVESANYIVISYALSSTAFLFGKPSIFSVLFFASECWLMVNYWEKARGLTGGRIVTAVMIAVCFAAHCLIVYSIVVYLGTFNG